MQTDGIEVLDRGADSSIPIQGQWQTADNPNTSCRTAISEMVLYCATREGATPNLRGIHVTFAIPDFPRRQLRINYQSKLVPEA